VTLPSDVGGRAKVGVGLEVGVRGTPVLVGTLGVLPQAERKKQAMNNRYGKL
jgi:hypothetical protein